MECTKFAQIVLMTGIAVAASWTKAETTTWTGKPSQQGAADWNAAGNWSSGVPAPGDTVVIPRVDVSRVVMRLTPAETFAGTIILSNGVEEALGPALRVALAPGGGGWKVTGASKPGGWLIATEGIAAHIADDFKGTIEIPKGVSLALPASLTAGVAVVGAGDLVLASSAQLPLAAGFAGTVRLAGETLSPADIAGLSGRSFALADGQTLDLSAHMLALGGLTAIPTLDDASAWTYNALTWATGDTAKYAAFSTEFPRTDADGGFRLVDDPAQHRIVVYKGRTFGLSDAWGVSYTHDPTLPTDNRFTRAGCYQTESGWFAIGLRSDGPTVEPGKSMNMDGFCGLSAYYYRDEGHQGLFWVQNGFNWDAVFGESAMGGLDLRKPYDVTATCVDGVFTVTLRQGAQSVTLRRDISAALRASSRGLYLSIEGMSDYWRKSSPTIPWMTHTIRNFRGWSCRTSDAPWSDAPAAATLLPITKEKWTLRTIDKVNHVTNDASQIESGRVVLTKPFKYQALMLHGSQPISVDRPSLVSFDVVCNACEQGDSGSSFSFGLTAWNANDWRSTELKHQYMDGITMWDETWAQGWGLRWNFWSGSRVMRLFQPHPIYKEEAWKRTDAKVDGAAPFLSAGCTGRFDFLYDAAGTVRVSLRVTDKDGAPRSAHEYVQTLTDERFGYFKADCKNGAYLDFRAVNTWGWMGLSLENVKIRELVSNANPTVDSPVCVADGASATVTVGAIDAASETLAATLSGVTLGKGASLTVYPEGASAKIGVATVTAVGAGALTAGSGAGVRSLGRVVLTGNPTDGVLALAGDVTFAPTFTLVVPAGWCKLRTPVAALDLSAVTGVTPNPSAVRIVTDAGADVTERASCTLTNGVLTINLAKGLVINLL